MSEWVDLRNDRTCPSCGAGADRTVTPLGRLLEPFDDVSNALVLCVEGTRRFLLRRPCFALYGTMPERRTAPPVGDEQRRAGLLAARRT